MQPKMTPNSARNSFAVRYFTTAQAAERLYSTIRTLERWRKTGFGPTYVKLGKRVLYSEEALAAWEASRSFTSTAAETRNTRLAA